MIPIAILLAANATTTDLPPLPPSPSPATTSAPSAPDLGAPPPPLVDVVPPSPDATRAPDAAPYGMFGRDHVMCAPLSPRKCQRTESSLQIGLGGSNIGGVVAEVGLDLPGFVWPNRGAFAGKVDLGGWAQNDSTGSRRVEAAFKLEVGFGALSMTAVQKGIAPFVMVNFASFDLGRFRADSPTSVESTTANGAPFGRVDAFYDRHVSSLATLRAAVTVEDIHQSLDINGYIFGNRDILFGRAALLARIGKVTFGPIGTLFAPDKAPEDGPIPAFVDARSESRLLFVVGM